ncbi:alginate export family protein [Bauldia sp.]|uniref:alginate export family protein n=1 Tax=Bauldia sp. TaxID=2575872 RepID=UPI003BAAF8F8
MNRVAAGVRGAACIGPLLLACGALADDRAPWVLYEDQSTIVRGHFEAGTNLVGEENLFWDLAGTFAAEEQYDPDKVWLEGYVKPGVSFERGLAEKLAFYGALSAVLSGTAGTDAYETGDTGRLTLEEGYVGLKFGESDTPVFDLSVGPRELRLGTGMLIANGASNGFERGALKLGPRKAWEFAAIAQSSLAGATATGFYLDANELTTSDTHTTLAGLDLRADGADGGYLGLTLFNVPQSDSVYPKAAPGGFGPPIIVPGAREGLNVVDVYARTNWLAVGPGQAFADLEFAYEWNDRIDMQAWGGRAQAGYVFSGHPWRPRITQTFQTFSGDDPNTAALERFDPLFYDGSPAAWATGSKSAMTFINSNVNAYELAIGVTPTPRDILTLRYTHIRANELRSPIQFGQAARFEVLGQDSIITGVTNRHLADDVFLEYTRVLNPNTFLTGGVSASFPGKGLDLAVADTPPVWLGGFVNVVVSY